MLYEQTLSLKGLMKRYASRINTFLCKYFISSCTDLTSSTLPRPKSCTGLFTCSHLLARPLPPPPPPPPHQQLSSSSSSHILLNFYWHYPPSQIQQRLPMPPSTDSCNFSIVLTSHEQHSDDMTAHLLQSRGGIKVETKWVSRKPSLVGLPFFWWNPEFC